RLARPASLLRRTNPIAIARRPRTRARPDCTEARDLRPELRNRCVLLARPPSDFRLTARREGRSDLGEHAVSIHDCRVALLDRRAGSLRSRAGGARHVWCQSRRLYVDAGRCVVRRGPFSHHRTTYSQPTTLHCAAFRCSVDCRAAGDRMRVPRSGTRTEHLRRAADCVRADLPPAVLLTVVVVTTRKPPL